MENKIFIKIKSERVTYGCKPDINDVVKTVLDEYERDDVKLSEVIANIEISGLSIEDVVKVYARCFDIVEKSKVVRIADGSEIDLKK